MIKKIYFLMLVVSCLYTQAQQVKKTTGYDKMVHLLDSGYFSISVDYAMPMSGRMIYLSSAYYGLDFYKDSVVCYLPYFGRVYNTPFYPRYLGIQFAMSLKEFKKTYDPKKQKCDIQFSAADESDVYDFFITIFPNKNVSISVNSVFKEYISYTGHLSKLGR